MVGVGVAHESQCLGSPAHLPPRWTFEVVISRDSPVQSLAPTPLSNMAPVLQEEIRNKHSDWVWLKPSCMKPVAGPARWGFLLWKEALVRERQVPNQKPTCSLPAHQLLIHAEAFLGTPLGFTELSCCPWIGAQSHVSVRSKPIWLQGGSVFTASRISLCPGAAYQDRMLESPPQGLPGCAPELG